jgi:rSAM/selenodomain-associated transferase 1
MPPEAAIIIMAKQPQPGHTKTRLCPPLTPNEAAALYEALLRDTIDLVAGVPGCALAVAITPATSRAYFEAITPRGAILLPISGADIGRCLDQALGQLLVWGFRKALALNADGPSLPASILQQAVAALDTHNLVLGPARDGGYYLIGLKHLHPALFEGIAWSTDAVLAQTICRAATLGLDVCQLPPWYDVDTAADIARIQAELAGLPAGRLVHTRRFIEGWSRK